MRSVPPQDPDRRRFLTGSFISEHAVRFAFAAGRAPRGRRRFAEAGRERRFSGPPPVAVNPDTVCPETAAHAVRQQLVTVLAAVTKVPPIVQVI